MTGLRACLLVLLAGVKLAIAAPAPWGALSEWDGHYPSDTIGGHRMQLLKVPAIAAALSRVLPGADQRLLQSYTVEQPVTRVGSLLLVKQCLPHDCGARHATIVIDTASDRIWVGLVTHTERLVTSRWFASDPLHDLPTPVLGQTVEAD